MSQLKLSLLVCALGATMWAQSSKSTPTPSAAPASGQVAAEPAAAAFKPTTDDLLADVQMSIRGDHQVGMVWWIPFEFWEVSDESGKAAEAVKGLRDYTVIAVVTGRVGPFGNITYQPAEKVRASTFIRDSDGIEYAKLDKVPEDVEFLSQVLQPVFTNALGKMGENINLIFFPGKSKNGHRIDDPHGKGDFTVLLKNDIAGDGTHAFDFHLPLNSLAPPKYCPKGNERVQANWKYCPWHGVALTEEAKK
jgi:hypothetical protein